MTEKDRKTQTVTTKLWKRTKDQLIAQAKKKGISLSEYVQELADRDSGFEAVEEITLPPKALRHQESSDEGYASGVVAILASLAERGFVSDCWSDELRELGVNPKMAVEWDLRILRKTDPSIPFGRLPKDHPRAPKEKTGQTAVTI